jgi:hypothetical protein
VEIITGNPSGVKESHRLANLFPRPFDQQSAHPPQRDNFN